MFVHSRKAQSFFPRRTSPIMDSGASVGDVVNEAFDGMSQVMCPRGWEGTIEGRSQNVNKSGIYITKGHGRGLAVSQETDGDGDAFAVMRRNSSQFYQLTQSRDADYYTTACRETKRVLFANEYDPKGDRVCYFGTPNRSYSSGGQAEFSVQFVEGEESGCIKCRVFPDMVLYMVNKDSTGDTRCYLASDRNPKCWSIERHI